MPSRPSWSRERAICRGPPIADHLGVAGCAKGALRRLFQPQGMLWGRSPGDWRLAGFLGPEGASYGGSQPSGGSSVELRAGWAGVGWRHAAAWTGTALNFPVLGLITGDDSQGNRRDIETTGRPPEH
jgi:hypothetical protein